MGRDKQPTAGVIDSQTSKSINICQDTGYDGGKKMKGRKRQIVTDVKGHLLSCKVHAANISDNKGTKLVLPLLALWFSYIKIIFADMGYSGTDLADWVSITFSWVLKIIKRQRKKFQVVKFRWVVERTFAWLVTHRRLSKSYEVYAQSEESWIYLSACRVTLRRIAV